MKLHALPSTQSFDVLVLGPQVAGAVAGALLSRRGYRVLAIEHAPNATGYVDGDFRLPLGPTVIPQLRAIPAAQAVLDELGLGPDVARSSIAVGCVQVLAQDTRLDLYLDTARRASDIRREFNGEGDRFIRAIDELLAREEQNSPLFKGEIPLPAEGISERWTQRNAMADLKLGDAADLVTPQEHPLARGLKELWRLSNHLVEQESLPEPKVVEEPARLALRPLSHWLRGISLFPGGEAGLAALLRKRIEASGGAVLGGEKGIVEELRIDHGRVSALKLLDSPNEYRAKSVVAAMDSASLRDLVPATHREGKAVQALDAVRTRSQLVTLNLVVDAKGLPPGLSEVAIGLPPGQARSFFLQVGPATRAQGPSHDEKLVTLAIQVPPQSVSAGAETVRKLTEELRRDAELFLPFLSRHILLESSPLLAAPDASSGQRRLHPRIEIARPRQLGVTGLEPHAVFKNVVLASHEVLPGLGLEGQFLTGLTAATAVQKMVKKADPLEKR